MTFASDREFYFRAHPGQPHSWGTDHKFNEVVCTVGEWDSARDRFGCSASPELEIDRLNRELASLLEAVEPLLAAAGDPKVTLMKEKAAYAQMQTTGEYVEISFTDLEYLFDQADIAAQTAAALRDLLGPTGGQA